MTQHLPEWVKQVIESSRRYDKTADRENGESMGEAYIACRSIGEPAARAIRNPKAYRERTVKNAGLKSRTKSRAISLDSQTVESLEAAGTSTVESVALMSDVRACLQAMPEQSQQLVREKIDGRTCNEIAGTLGISPQAVSKRWIKLRTHLQQQLKDYDDAC